MPRGSGTTYGLGPESRLIQGNTAILTFYSRTPGAEKGVKSCDIFLYSGGSWHAIYSQHTTAGA